MTLDELNRFLKTLKSTRGRLERILEYVKQIQADVTAINSVLSGENGGSGSGSHSKVENGAIRLYEAQERYQRELEKYYAMEDKLNTVMNADLNDEERDIIVSHYILRRSFQRIAREQHFDERTIFRKLKGAKQKILQNWQSCQ